MFTTNYHKNIAWYHFQDEIQKEEFKNLTEKYQINKYIRKKFTNDSNRDKTIMIKNSLFFSISIPNYKNNDFEKQILKFIIGKDYIISYTNTLNEGLERFRKDFEKNADFGKNEENENPVIYSILHIFEKIYENILFELKNIEGQITKIEDQIFNDQEEKMVKSISILNRKIIDFKRFLDTHDDSWKIFIDLSKLFFTETKNYSPLEGILLSYQKTISKTKQLQETISVLSDTNNSLLNAKLGKSSKAFTLIAFLTLPINLFVSIISIPTKQEHVFLGHNNDLNLIILVSIFLVILMALIAKIKKWW